MIYNFFSNSVQNPFFVKPKLKKDILGFLRVEVSIDVKPSM
ncbi:hypothetical protein HMPREF1015_00637 [Bacillus smithii 7_3_47FAA]|uniref:Uncharacterized protein n=1 Tax=Bacillus smithii 7_3_47FAA TaxID=665952 RepID=G9QM70_9BACI|nr:hypothetical protein HMPREF1015_00637 [Bacillus smithii 7_3_47FAA]